MICTGAGIVFHVIKTVERVECGKRSHPCGGRNAGAWAGCAAPFPRELVSCWDWAVQKSDLLRGALRHETLPAVTQCGGCGRIPTVAPGQTCPRCGSRTHGCCGAARSTCGEMGAHSMVTPQIIEVKESVFADNDREAARLRQG